MQVFENHPLKKLTSFKQAGTVQNFIVFEDIDELQSWVKNPENEYEIIGNGSNVLMNTHTFKKTLIKMSPNISQAKVVDDHSVLIPGSFSIIDCHKFLSKHSLSALAFSAGVPASIGGMTAMNFSCWDQEMANQVKRVRILNQKGQIEWWSPQECEFDYRHSRILKEKALVIEVELFVNHNESHAFRSECLKYLKLRQAHQPLNTCCFGSIFKNPAKSPAGYLIEHSQLKNTQKGEIIISNQHANFLVNLSPGEGLFKDAIDLIHLIENTVLQDHQVQLEKEVVIYD